MKQPLWQIKTSETVAWLHQFKSVYTYVISVVAYMGKTELNHI